MKTFNILEKIFSTVPYNIFMSAMVMATLAFVYKAMKDCIEL